MIRCARHFSFLAFLLASFGCGGGGGVPKASFKPSKETTFITEPIDKDGYLDYETALNERLRGKITPETNANVLLWQALGPKPEGQSMHADYWKWLGIEAPPEGGDYFVDVKTYLRRQGRSEFDEEFDNLGIRLASHPWTAKEFPDRAAWLETMAGPLDLVRRATLRSEYFNPLVPRSKKGERIFLLDSPLSNLQPSRAAADALLKRAMLKSSEGKNDGAWDDLLATHRLARLIARGGTFIETLVACAIDVRAHRASLAFLSGANLGSDRAKKCLDDLRKLKPMPGVASTLDSAERYSLLDLIQFAGLHGFDSLEDLTRNREPRTPDATARAFLGRLDWDPIFRRATSTYDRVVKSLGLPTRAERIREWTAFQDEMIALRDELGDNASIGEVVRAGGDPGPAVSEKIGKILVTLLFPAVHKIIAATDRFEQQQRNLQLAFALAAYRADHGKYPAQLADLAPKFIDKVPLDYFTDKPLNYKPNASGYLLYSVGENGQDDGGASFDDDPKGDDLSVRMPSSKPMDK